MYTGVCTALGDVVISDHTSKIEIIHTLTTSRQITNTTQLYSFQLVRCKQTNAMIQSIVMAIYMTI